ncbi:MAG: hypothetical protein DRG50_06545 [Deltaproteobacteria bacterium]|nr:MAG: hypothetical protein DRG50_06545 [Deltaproteobacteria bacterium]
MRKIPFFIISPLCFFQLDPRASKKFNLGQKNHSWDKKREFFHFLFFPLSRTLFYAINFPLIF